MAYYPFLNHLIIHLNEKGFDQDFVLTGNDLFWVQSQKSCRAGDFAILEWHRLYKKAGAAAQVLVLGVSAIFQEARGILIIELKHADSKPPPVLVKKLNELELQG